MAKKKIDKRTKEYKEYKKKFEDKNTVGAGDVIEKITKKTGIKKVVKFVAGEDCGCDKRKEKANDLFRWKIARCPTEPQYNWMKSFFSKKVPNEITADQQREINRILNHTFNLRLKHVNCCMGQRIKNLEKLYKTYS